MCKFESSQKDESRWQWTDSSKAYGNASAFKCRYYKCFFYAQLSLVNAPAHRSALEKNTFRND